MSYVGTYPLPESRESIIAILSDPTVTQGGVANFSTMSTILLFALAMAMAVAAGSEHHHHSVRLSYGDVVGQRVVQWTSMQKEPATVKWGTSESDLGE